MYDKDQVKAYQSITAPENLRERVLSECEIPKRKSNANIYRLSGLAACLAVFIAVTMIFGSIGGVKLSVNGETLTSQPMALPMTAAMADARAVLGITIEAKLDRNSIISTSDGEVYIFDVGTGEALNGEISAKEVTIVWSIVPTDTEKTYILTIENSRGSTEVSLLFNEAAGWQICCTEN